MIKGADYSPNNTFLQHYKICESLKVINTVKMLVYVL